MTIKKYDKIIDNLITLRGEDGCEEACKKLKKNYNVEKMLDIPIRYANKILDKLEGEITLKNAEEIFEIDEEYKVKCSNCGKDSYRKGMFYICNHCHKVFDSINQ